MELISKVVKVIKDKPVVISPIGDLQYTGKNGVMAEDTLKRHIDRSLELGAYFVGMGDMGDFASPSNRQRIRGAALYDTSEEILEDKAIDLMHELYERYLKPTKGRWLGCVPMHSQALTRTGWKTPDKLIIGEEILAYDAGSGLCRWTPLRNIVSYADEPVVCMSSKSFTSTSTPDHRWVVLSPTHVDGSRELVSKIVRTDELKSSQRIVIAASAESGPLDLSPLEAAVLGWLITDGTVFWKPKWKQTQAFIYQSKPHLVKKLKKLLKGVSTYRVDTRSETVIIENGKSRRIQRQYPNYRFYIKKPLLWSILNKTGFTGPSDLIRIITNLSVKARKSMLQAMLDAEGDSRCVFTQNSGEVLEAFKVLATLEGYRIGRTTAKSGQSRQSHIQLCTKRPVADVNDLKFSPQDPTSVWCPQTDFGTWVMKQDDQITITGNCLSGHHWYQLRAGHTTDMLLCQLLDTAFLGTSALIRLQLDHGHGHRQSIQIWAHHGTGGGTKSATPLNKLEAVAPYWDADIYLMGHTSKMATAPMSRVYARWDVPGGPDLTHRKIILVGTGGFSKSYVKGARQGQIARGGYAEEGMMNPIPLGAPLVFVRPVVTHTKSASGNNTRTLSFELSAEV